MTNNKIGAGGAAVLLALARIFTEAAALPGENPGYGMQRFTVLILSFLLTAAAYLPLILAVRSADGRSPLGLIASGSKLLSGFFGVLISVFLLFGAAETGLRSHYYTSSTVFDSAPSAYFYIFIGLALIFAVKCGLEAVSRTGMIVTAILALLMTFVLLALMRDIRLERLYPAFADEPGSLFSDTMREFSRNGEYLLFAALCGSIRGKRGRTIPLYIGISGVAVLAMTFLYNTVLGRLTDRLSFPFYTLSTISDTGLLHRINGIDVAVWVMAGILRLALFAFAFRAVVRDCFGAGKAADIAAYVFCAAALLLSGLFTAYPEIYDPMRRICGSGIPLATAAVLLPAAAFLCPAIRKAAAE